MARKAVAVEPVQPVGFTHVLANEVGETLAVIRPFVVWPLLAVGAALLHHFWAMSVYAVAFLVVSAVLIPVLVWFLHDEHHIGEFVHTAITSALIASILGMVDIAGWTKASIFAVLFVVPMICLTWSIRGAISARNEAKGQHLTSYFDQAGLPDTHMKVPKPDKKKKGKSWFRREAAEATPEDLMPEGKQRMAAVGQRVTGTVHLPPGGIPDDVVKNLRRVESAGGYPPGTFTVTQNTDHAGIGDVVMSDPRVISKPVPWRGPSYLGRSIAAPLSVGVYQDGTEIEFPILGTQLQIMGQTGSGKSLGAGWSTLSEVITRHDAIVWGIDVTKGMQTLGPLAPALHRLATDDDEARQLLTEVHALIKPRTNYLADKGLPSWQEGCGINYLVIWLEEVPDIMTGIGKTGKETWIRSIKAARSAGISFVWSLQRSDFTQISTIVRGQGGKWCFGVADDKEAKFGLSTAQVAAKCEPQLWSNRKPGMSFIDVPGIQEDKIPMAGRTWYFGPDDSIIKAHALNYPASDRPYDDIMKSVLGMSTAGTTLNIPLAVKPVDPDAVMTTDQARTHVRAWLMSHKDEDITGKNIPEMIEGTGRERTWGYKAMREFVAEGLVTKQELDDKTYLWRVVKK